MDTDELKVWLRLLLTPGLGRQSARQLLHALGSPQAVFEASAADWQALGLSRQLPALGQEPPELAEQLARTLAWLEGADRCVLTLADSDYPSLLLQTEDPPLLLFAMGTHAHRWQDAQGRPPPSLAVVGSRNPTPQGELNARQFAQALAGAGVCVVSGLALGVDGAAHAGALDAGGATVAVVGTGLDRVYPKRHLELAHRICSQGAIVSEYLLGTPPLPAHFPQRNRLIAGLAQATLVVEANLQSGSLITARLAAEQGRDVLAIPGSIHSPQSRGCLLLLQEGARLVTSVEDVMDELGCPAAPRAAPPPCPSPAAEHALLQTLGFDPMGLDELQQRCGWPTDRLQAELLELELSGRLARLPGGLYQRLARV
jgi:DNA processing protein